MADNEFPVDNPYAPPLEQRSGYLAPDRGKHLMTLGITGAVFLGALPIISFIVGSMGWARAKHDLEEMAAGRMSTRDGARAKTKAGLILGKINTIVAPFALITIVLYIWLLMIEARL